MKKLISVAILTLALVGCTQDKMKKAAERQQYEQIAQAVTSYNTYWHTSLPIPRTETEIRTAGNNDILMWYLLWNSFARPGYGYGTPYHVPYNSSSPSHYYARDGITPGTSKSSTVTRGGFGSTSKGVSSSS